MTAKNMMGDRVTTVMAFIISYLCIKINSVATCVCHTLCFNLPSWDEVNGTVMSNNYKLLVLRGIYILKYV